MDLYSCPISTFMVCKMAMTKISRNDQRDRVESTILTTLVHFNQGNVQGVQQLHCVKLYVSQDSDNNTCCYSAMQSRDIMATTMTDGTLTLNGCVCTILLSPAM